MIPSRTWLLWLIGCAALGALGQCLAGPDAGRCALDGITIEPLNAVDVRLRGEDETRSFHSVHCAVTWIAETGGIADEIIVRDEVTGSLLTAERALFVRDVAAPRRLHIYKDWAAALKHTTTAAQAVRLPGPGTCER